MTILNGAVDMQRKFFLLLLAGVLLLLAGCIYEAPLTGEHTIAVASAVLGLWEFVPGEGEKPGPPERMMVLRYSDTEYLIHYPMGQDGMYFRGYEVRVGGVPCVQLQLLGSEEGPVERNEKDLFQVASYQLVGDELLVRTLNRELVADELKDSAALRKAFLNHRSSKELFTNPGRFKRVAGKK